MTYESTMTPISEDSSAQCLYDIAFFDKLI